MGRAATGSVRTKALLPAFLLHNFEQLRRRPDPRPRPSANFEFVQNAAKFVIVILRRIELQAFRSAEEKAGTKAAQSVDASMRDSTLQFSSRRPVCSSWLGVE